MNKYSIILELNKIMSYVKKETILDESKDILDNITLQASLNDIRKELSRVDEATILSLRMGRISILCSSNVKEYILKSSKNGVLSIEEILEVSKLLDSVKNNILYLNELIDNQISCNYFKTMIDSMAYLKDLNLLIKKMVSPFGEINDDASRNLCEIRKTIKNTERAIQNKLTELLSKHSSKLSESIVSIRNNRYVIPVKNDYKSSIKGITHDVSSSGETVWIEPLAVFDLNNRLNSLYEEENEEINRILKIISSEIEYKYEELINDYNILLDLDIVFAKASYSIKIEGKKPNLNQDGIVELINCHHPLLNVEKIVSNNIIIGKDYKGIIITGPNTGGKTVLLKTLGLLSLMVKIGLLIPCDETSNINVFDNVFADIGDEQSIEQNLSTFSSHMKNVIDIMDSVTPNSLVLIDELGSGTNPVEGSSLAISIIDYLISKNCLVVTTSHYSELKLHAFNSENIINASVEFDIKTLKPTYKLLIGVPGQSNALKISKLLGLKEEIIDAANKYAYHQNNEVNIVLDKLVNQSHQLDQKIKQIEFKEEELNRIINENKALKEKILIDKKAILTKAENDSRMIIEKSNKTIEKILLELEEMKLREVKLHEVAQIKGQLKSLKEELHYEEEVLEENKELDVNMSVFVENYGCYGIILKKNNNNKFDVQIGNATITIDKKYLKYVNKSKTEKLVKKTNTSVGVKKNVKMSLDLRGQRYEDAKLLLEKYIDDALYASLQQVTIIHGFGTGTIRELVHKTIKEYSKDIESYRYGGAGEGGQGVTIIIFKSK